MEPDGHAVCMRGRRTAIVIDQTHAAVSATGNLAMRWLRRVSGIVWIFSWYTIYLEIFRWHHMTKTLRFNPPPPLPGTDIQPRPGAPLIAVCLGSVTAPLVFLTATMIERIRARPGNTPPRRLTSKSWPASRKSGSRGSLLRPRPSRTGRAVLTASASSKPRRAVQVREDAGSWLPVAVARRWQWACISL